VTPLRIQIALHLGAALLAGGAIGLERSFHGRPAGFRTHTLVCMASALLMLLTVFSAVWFPGAAESVRIDPTRMAQGIMTGIGFLGAGVIFQEGITVRGLTTAASIWITSAIGILMGTGLYFAGTVATVLTLGVLSGFRRIEALMPSEQFAHHRIRFDRGNVMTEGDVRRLLRSHGFAVSGMSYRITDDGGVFEYRMTIRTKDPKNYARLARSLGALEPVREFLISPAGD
jgi:putative Mg2+ transporter-C (MgtC) family protein